MVKLTDFELYSNSLTGIVNSSRCLDRLLNISVGAVTSGVCQLTLLQTLSITLSGNAAITCAPLCVSFVAARTVPSAICPTYQDTSLCSFIGATNIQSINTMWSCLSNGITSTNPCSPVWTGLACNGSIVVSISFPGIGLSGLYCSSFNIAIRYV